MATICPSCGTKNLEGLDACQNCGGELRTVDLPKPAAQIEQTVMNLPLTSLALSTVHAVAPDTTLEAAVAALSRQKLDILEVVEDGKLIGVFSVRDLVTRVGPRFASQLDRPVREFMTPSPATLPPDAPITFLLNAMEVGGYRHVPVVQGDHLLGVASARDLIAYLVKHGREEVAPAGATTSHGVEGVPGSNA